MSAISELIERCEEGDYLGAADPVVMEVFGEHAYAAQCATTGTPNSRLNYAFLLVEKMLPDFWITCGLCSLTGHASIGPDYNGPARERLMAEWPNEQFHAGFDADLEPGDGVHRVCFAILHCVLQALSAKAALIAKAAP